jgi:hypothetical protein
MVGGGGGHSIFIDSLQITFKYEEGDETQPKIVGNTEGPHANVVVIED